MRDLEGNISGFRTGHSTTSVLLSIRGDVLKAINRNECTLLVLADFSKAFDTVKYRSVVEKMNGLGFQGHTLNGQSTTPVEVSTFFKLMTLFQNLLALTLESHKAQS